MLGPCAPQGTDAEKEQWQADLPQYIKDLEFSYEVRSALRVCR